MSIDEQDNKVTTAVADSLTVVPNENQIKILQADAIQNYKAIAAFGNDQILIHEFGNITTKAASSRVKATLLYAISHSLTVAVNNGIFAILYFAVGEFSYKWPVEEVTAYDKMFIAMFTFMFGAFTAA